MSEQIKFFTALLLATFLVYGSISRWTHGVWTPDYYAYQIDRVPDDGSGMAFAVPFRDLFLAVLVLIPRWRAAGAALATAVLAMGMIVRRFEEKDATLDGVIALTAFTCWMILGKIDW